MSSDRLETLRLLVSEVVTNSVRHGCATESVQLAIDVSNPVKVEVADSGTGFVPSPRATAPTEVGGWGLFLVEQLAERWGVSRDGHSTRVWFCLPAC